MLKVVLRVLRSKLAVLPHRQQAFRYTLLCVLLPVSLPISRLVRGRLRTVHEFSSILPYSSSIRKHATRCTHDDIKPPGAAKYSAL